jgi:tetratricopeptide (TPR) repeat protein
VHAPAEAINALGCAVVCLEEAIPSGCDFGQEVGVVTARLQESLGDALALRGRWSEARVAFERAMPHVAEPVTVARLIRKIGGTFSGEIRGADASATYARADAMLSELPVEVAGAELVQVRLEHIWALYLHGDGSKLDELLARTRPLVERFGSAANRALLHHRAVNAAFRRERYVVDDAVLAEARAALEAASEAGDPGGICRSFHLVGFCHLWRLENQEAERALSLSAEAAARIGDLAQEVRALVYLALAERRLGRFADARRHCETVVRAHNEYEGVAEAICAWMDWLEGERVQVVVDAETALNGILTRFSPTFPFRWLALIPLVDAALARRNLDEAIAHARVVHDPPQQRLLLLESDLAMALRAHAAGEGEVARAALERAVATARDRL